MQIETASRRKQLVLLHEKITSQIDRALNSETEFPEKRHRLNKAQNILSQLQIALKTEEIPQELPTEDEPISQEEDMIQTLFHLYEYLYNKLESNLQNDWADGLEIAQTLSETFKELLTRK